MKFSNTQKLTVGIATMILLSSTQFVDAQSNLSNLEEQKNQLQKNALQSKNTQLTLTEKLNDIENDIEALEKEMFSLQKEIEKTNIAIEEKELFIIKTKKEIAEITTIIEEKSVSLDIKKLKLEEHLKLMHSGGKVELIEILFRSQNLSQFINRYEYYLDITKKAEILHNEIKEEITFIELQKSSLIHNKSILETEKVKLLQHKKVQTTQRAKQKKLQSSLEVKKHDVEEDIHEQKDAIQILLNSIAQTEKEIKEEKARIEAARKKAEAERRKREEDLRKKEQNNQAAQPTPSNPSQGSGILGSPLSKGSYYISSHFGYRKDPVTGKSGTFHSGTDFAAPKDTPIYAVADGYVLFSGPAKGYGNWIVIKHDNGLYTIYGHMYSNQLYVNKGDYVFKGAHIGGVGSAGKSTGNHLHLCVATSYNGSSFTYANPLNYIR